MDQPPLVQDPYNPANDRISRRDRNFAVVIFGITLALFWQVKHFDFLGLDDPMYVSSNAMMLGGLNLHSLHWAFIAHPNGNWHPLTTIAQLAISSAFGIKPAPYHLVNAFLHAINAALVYLFFRRCTGLCWPACFTALLWGLHPLRIESVAWVTELKDVLYGFFWLAALLAYVRYTGRRNLGNYALLALLFIASLLSKPMAVTLPPLLLLLDFWPLSRQTLEQTTVSASRWWTVRVLEKLPLLAVSIADTLAQPNAALIRNPLLPWSLRIENAVVSLAWYVRDLVFPRHIHLLYPYPALLARGISMPSVWFSLAVLVLITVAAFRLARKYPFVVIGWLWFLGTLMPVLGFIQNGEQSRADRFTYMPSLGLVMAIVWLVHDLSGSKRTLSRLAVAGALAAAVALAIVTRLDLPRWTSSKALFTDLHQMEPDNFYATSQVGYDAVDDHKPALAIELGKHATELAPYSGSAWGMYGHILCFTGHLGQAQTTYIKAIGISASSENWDGLGIVYDKEANLCSEHHDPSEMKFRKLAVEDFRQAIATSDNDPSLREHLAFQLALIPGRMNEAIAQWQELVDMAPKYADAQGQLAVALRLTGDIPGAVAHFRAAIADGSKDPAWEAELAWLVATSPQASPADVLPMVDLAKDACDQTNNHDAKTLDAYAACLARVARYDDAVMAAQQAVAQANAAHEPAVAAGIARRLALYQNQQIYVAEAPATKPTTAPVMGPTTTP